MTPGTFLRKHTLWVGLIAVLAPLAVLLGLQYSWLVTLDRNSAKVQEVTLKNYLEAVVDKVEWRYRNDAERVLNVGNYVFLNDRLDKAAYHFKKKGVTGVKRLFVASFVHDNHGKVLYFEPTCSSFTVPMALLLRAASETTEWRAPPDQQPGRTRPGPRRSSRRRYLSSTRAPGARTVDQGAIKRLRSPAHG